MSFVNFYFLLTIYMKINSDIALAFKYPFSSLYLCIHTLILVSPGVGIRSVTSWYLSTIQVNDWKYSFGSWLRFFFCPLLQWTKRITSSWKCLTEKSNVKNQLKVKMHLRYFNSMSLYKVMRLVFYNIGFVDTVTWI